MTRKNCRGAARALYIIASPVTSTKYRRGVVVLKQHDSGEHARDDEGRDERVHAAGGGRADRGAIQAACCAAAVRGRCGIRIRPVLVVPAGEVRGEVQNQGQLTSSEGWNDSPNRVIHRWEPSTDAPSLGRKGKRTTASVPKTMKGIQRRKTWKAA